MLPAEVTRSLSQQWPCRELQTRQLANLLADKTPSPSTVVVHGISATCKSTIVRAVLSALEVPHGIVRSSECITGRHLLTKILWSALEALDLKGDWEKFGKGRCEHVSTLAVLLGQCLAERPGKKFVLVLDGIDKQREAPYTLLPALGRLGEMIPSLCVVLILSTTPRPLFLHAAGVPHINFPPYTRVEAAKIMLHLGAPATGLAEDVAARLYPHFVYAIYDSLVGPTVASIPSFRSICERLWPQFVSPILDGQTPPGDIGEWDFARLLVKNRSMFRHQGESALVHHIVTDESSLPANGTTKSSSTPAAVLAPSPLPTLPYFPTLILTSAYLASHIPQRLDTIFFSKFSSSSLSARNKRAHHRRRLKVLSQAQAEDAREAASGTSTPAKKGKRTKTRITKHTLNNAFATSSATTSAAAAGITGPSTILTARPFPLERLVAIYHAVDPNPPANPVRLAAMSDAIYAELATLRRLRLVVPAAGRDSGGRMGLGSGGLSSGNTSADAGEKWCVNVSGDWIGEMAKTVGVEVGEWLAGGLD